MKSSAYSLGRTMVTLRVDSSTLAFRRKWMLASRASRMIVSALRHPKQAEMAALAEDSRELCITGLGPQVGLDRFSNADNDGHQWLTSCLPSCEDSRNSGKMVSIRELINLLDSCMDGSYQQPDFVWHFNTHFPTLRLSQEGHSVRALSRMSHNSIVKRSAVVQHIVSFHDDFPDLKLTTLFLAVQIADVALLKEDFSEFQLKPLSAIACLLACKFIEFTYPSLDCINSWLENESNTHSAKDLEKLELMLLSIIEYRLHHPSAAHHLDWFQSLNMDKSNEQHLLAHYLATLGLLCPQCAKWPPASHATAAIMGSNWLMGHSLRQPLLAKVCNFDSTSCKTVGAIFRSILHHLIEEAPSNEVFRKFSHTDFCQIAPRAHELAVKHLNSIF